MPWQIGTSQNSQLDVGWSEGHSQLKVAEHPQIPPKRVRLSGEQRDASPSLKAPSPSRRASAVVCGVGTVVPLKRACPMAPYRIKKRPMPTPNELKEAENKAMKTEKEVVADAAGPSQQSAVDMAIRSEAEEQCIAQDGSKLEAPPPSPPPSRRRTTKKQRVPDGWIHCAKASEPLHGLCAVKTPLSEDFGLLGDEEWTPEQCVQSMCVSAHIRLSTSAMSFGGGAARTLTAVQTAIRFAARQFEGRDEKYQAWRRA
eukprot:6172850-Pleurochrysis_carterae.AAC.3